MNASDWKETVRGRLIVSWKASEGDTFHDPVSMARFAAAARTGGAAAMRANGPADVAAIVRETGLPVIGIQKRLMEDGRVRITPTLEDARALVEAGAAAVALDCTARGRRHGAHERLRRRRAELRIPVCADIATEAEASAAAECGADFVLCTVRGYNDETAGIRAFQPDFIARLARTLPAPVIAEGMIGMPEEARAGVDIGGTNTKLGLVDETGCLLWSSVGTTPTREGAEALLNHLMRCAGWCAAEAAGSCSARHKPSASPPRVGRIAARAASCGQPPKYPADPARRWPR